MVFQHADKFSDNKYCESGDIRFLICHLTSHDHTFKGLREFNLLTTIQHLFMFGSHWSGASGILKFLMCHLASENYVIKGLCNVTK